ncbi:MAG: L-2-hydroxyglutarate oxidase [Sulfuricaulis sp.]
MSTFDFVVVGAGIVGLTSAFELRKRFPKSSIVVLEKESLPGKHASGRNSGVLHSGIYYGSDTLKAKVCSQGAIRMMEFAEAHGISYRRSGKVIIATSEQDIPTVERLLTNARDNNIRAIRLDESGIKEIEPYAKPYKLGIYSPDTAVIDSKAVVVKLHALLQQQNVQIIFNRPVTNISPEDKSVTAGDTRYRYGYLFNCAGAYADAIAKRYGLGEDYTLLPFKGIYYKLRAERDWLVRSNIYPVPDISLPFLGVHLTRVVGGDVYVGPTAMPALGRENYGLFQGIRTTEALKIGWRMATMYAWNRFNFRHLVHTETKKYCKSHFVKAVRKLVPEVTLADLVPCNKVGIRPQLVNVRDMKLEMDYIVQQTPTSLHVLNAISPAFTSSFAFAQLLVDRFEAGGRQ